jgi:Zn finger protein HypA/HybF involved in hydrogenase expression
MAEGDLVVEKVMIQIHCKKCNRTFQADIGAPTPYLRFSAEIAGEMAGKTVETEECPLCSGGTIDIGNFKFSTGGGVK